MTKTIEGDEDIQFAPIKDKADALENTLDDSINNSNPNHSTLGGMDIVVANKVWNAYLMLLDQFVEVNWLERLKDRWNGINRQGLKSVFTRDKAYKGLVCLISGFTYGSHKSGSAQVKYITPSYFQIECKQFKQLLLDMYGDSFKDTDVFQNIKDGAVDLDSYTHLPEVHNFKVLNGRRIRTESQIIINPFLLVYHVEPRYRPFIGGAILTAEENGEFASSKYDKVVPITNHAHPKPSMKSIFQYAHKVNETNLKEYLDLISQIPEIR